MTSAPARLLGASLLCSLFTACETKPLSDACKDIQAGDLIITEVMGDPDGADDGQEWIELFNTTGQSLDLRGLKLVTKKLDGTGAKSHALRTGDIEGRGYFVAGDASGALPEYINYSYGNDLGSIAADGLQLELQCANTTIDQVVLDKKFQSGRSWSLDPSKDLSAAANDTADAFCASSVFFADPNKGTPGSPNDTCLDVPEGSCRDSGQLRPASGFQEGDLVITELLADPNATLGDGSKVSDTFGEWIEVLVTRSIDLNGLRIKAGSSTKQISANDCLHVSPGQLLLFARSADAAKNGGLPAPDAVLDFSLSNSGSTLGLYDASLAVVIDELSFPKSSPGKALVFDREVVPGSITVCDAAAPYGLGDLGSPKAANEACVPTEPPDAGPVSPVLDAGLCWELDGGSRAIAYPAEGDLVITEVMSNPSGASDSDGEYVEILATNSVDFNGVELTRTDSATGALKINDATCPLPATPNAYYLFAKKSDPAVNGGLPSVFKTFGMSITAAYTLALRLDGGLLDQVTAPGTETAGRSYQVKPGFETTLDNDTALNWCKTPTTEVYPDGGFPDGGPGIDHGTPGAPNVACP